MKMAASKILGPDGKLVIQNYITARPVVRTKFDLGDWRNALIWAEQPNGTRVALYDLYDDVLLDAHLSSQWGKRCRGITNTDMMFTRDGVEVQEMSELMDSPEFEEMLTEIMEAVGWGKTVLEIADNQVNEMGKNVQRLSLYSVPRKHIRPKEGMIVKEQYDAAATGISFRTGPYVNYVADIGKDNDLGLLLKAVPWVLLKRGDVGDWAQFVQIFGMPFREYRYNGYDPATEAIIKKNAEEMGSAPYIILPDGAEIILHETKGTGVGGGDVYQKLADFCNKEISVLVLGNTLTTENTNVGSNALGQVHQDTEDDVHIADKKKVRRVLNRIIKPILFNLGWPVDGGIFTFKEEEDVAARLQKISLWQAIKTLGEPIDADQVYEDAGLEKPADYDAQKAKQEADKLAEQQAGIPPAGGKPPKPGKKKDKKLSDNLPGSKDEASETLWNKIRVMLADFFDPAP